MFWLDRIHRWTGGFIGLLLATLGLTGTLLIYKDAWLRATVPHAAEPLVKDAALVTAAVERLTSDPSSRPDSIIFPDDGLGLFKLSYAGDAGAYADQSGAIVMRWTSQWERPEIWLFDLHHHFFMGDTGTVVGGILAIIGMAFVVTGFLLWWRTRKSFAFRLLPARLTRLQIVRHHRDLGAVVAPLLIVSFLTATVLALRPVAEVLLAPFSSGPTITQSLAGPNVKGGPLAENFDWAATLETVRAKFPDARLRSISIPTGRGQLIRVRVRQPVEWLPNGRTIFWFDPADGRMVDLRDATALPLATRIYNLAYPVHAAKVGGIVYTAVMTLSGFTLTLLGTLAVFGFWSFRARQRAQVGTLLRE
jgi:uncharacterized iron-regulated membrane protein